MKEERESVIASYNKGLIGKSVSVGMETCPSRVEGLIHISSAEKVHVENNRAQKANLTKRTQCARPAHLKQPIPLAEPTKSIKSAKIPGPTKTVYATKFPGPTKTVYSTIFPEPIKAVDSTKLSQTTGSIRSGECPTQEPTQDKPVQSNVTSISTAHQGQCDKTLEAIEAKPETLGTTDNKYQPICSPSPAPVDNDRQEGAQSIHEGSIANTSHVDMIRAEFKMKVHGQYECPLSSVSRN